MRRMRIVGAALLLLLNTAVLAAADDLQVMGDVQHELHLTTAELRDLPHVEKSVRDPHSKKVIKVRGVWMTELLARAGVPLGEKLRGKALVTYLIAEASDGYRVLFSLGEIDPAISGGGVLLTDGENGKPLDEKTGPLRLVVPSDKRAARWVRQVKTLRVVTVQ